MQRARRRAFKQKGMVEFKWSQEGGRGLNVFNVRTRRCLNGMGREEGERMDEFKWVSWEFTQVFKRNEMGVWKRMVVHV